MSILRRSLQEAQPLERQCSCVQNCFLADVGDFGKFGLLRHLVNGGSTSTSKLSVIWYAVLSDQDRAASRYRYFEDSSIVSCDPPLARALRRIAINGALGDVPRKRILPVTTTYFSDPVPQSAIARSDWCNRAVGAARGRDIVFLDPDNGIAEHSTSTRHVSIAELARFAELGSTIVVYHHLHRRKPHISQLFALQRRVRQILSGRTVHLLWYRRGGSRAFIVAPPPLSNSTIVQRLQAFAKGPWAKHFTYLADPGE
jgi:hypothetical protein